MKLSIVIPAYNEEKDIEQAILDVVKVFPEAEIIIVNDASTDKTVKVIEDLMLPNITVLTNLTNMGHGYTVIKGLKAATGDYIMYIDADRQIHVDQILPKIVECDFLGAYRDQRKDKSFRKVISFCLRMTILFRHHMYIRDSNCPFKLYKREKLLPLLEELPNTNIIPIACLEVLARKHKLETTVIPAYHYPYDGVRKGFLQALNAKTLGFFGKAFMEMVGL